MYGDADVSEECAYFIQDGMPPDMCCICMEAFPFEEECTACPAGTYADAPAASACTSCPDGSTSPPGSSSASACTNTRRHLAVTTVNEKGVSQGPSIQENKLHVQELARVCEEKCDS